MSVVYKPFVADSCHQSFLDSQKLMAANFSDKVASSTEFLEWQYLKNPFGKAIGFIAYDGDDPVSQLFLTFQQVVFDGELHVVAVASNACTMESHRGQGHFHKIFMLLVDEARKLDVPFIWAYPNPNSLRGFIKTGFRIVKECSLELVPVSILGIVRDLLYKKPFSIDASVGDASVDMGQLSKFSLLTSDTQVQWPKFDVKSVRDRVWRVPLTHEQLLWRYLSNSMRKYYPMFHEATGTTVILRFVNLFGLTTALIMKSDARTQSVYQKVVKDLRIDLKGKVSFLTTMPSEFTRPGPRNFIRGRFLVPARLSPRKFPLAIYPIRSSIPLASPESYDFVLGDYEAL